VIIFLALLFAGAVLGLVVGIFETLGTIRRNRSRVK
jgi:hypothetical protein